MTSTTKVNVEKKSFIHVVKKPYITKQLLPSIEVDMLALLYNFTSVYTNIPSCRRDEL